MFNKLSLVSFFFFEKIKTDRGIMEKKSTMRITSAVLICVVLAAAEASDHPKKREIMNLEAVSQLTSLSNGRNKTGSLIFTQMTTCDHVTSFGSFTGLNNGTFIGLIHEGTKIGERCNTAGKALVAFSERNGNPTPLIAISKFSYHQEHGVLGIANYASLEKHDRNSIVDRILVIHRVPASNIDDFYKEALENGHHKSSVMCGFITSTIEAKIDPKHKFVHGIQRIIDWLWRNKHSVANHLAEHIISLTSDYDEL